MIREIQKERKRLGTKLNEYVDVVLPDWPPEHEEQIKQKTLTKQLTHGAEFSVRKT